MDPAEQIRRDFAVAWGRFGIAWGVAPSTATVQGYMLLHGGPLTEMQLRDALGFSHRATLLALAECESWGLIERTTPRRTGTRGPAATAWIPVGDHWQWFARVTGARKERETDPILPLLEDAQHRAWKVGSPELSARVDGLVQFFYLFDRGIGFVVRAEPSTMAHLLGALGRMDDETVDRLLAALATIPQGDLARAGSTVAGMRPDVLRAFIGLASRRGISRILRLGGSASGSGASG